jgi:hypothetical protein
MGQGRFGLSKAIKRTRSDTEQRVTDGKNAGVELYRMENTRSLREAPSWLALELDANTTSSGVRMMAFPQG